MTNLFFPLKNIISQPLTGSKATLKVYSSGDLSLSTFPVITFADVNGTASFNNVEAGIYNFTWTNANADTMSKYINEDVNELYLNIPDLSGSTVNGFDYIVTSSVTLNPNNSGSQTFFGDAKTLGVDITGMSNLITNYVNDWANKNAGAAFFAEDSSEKISIGFNNCVGPKCLIIYRGEQPHGDESVADLVAYVVRTYEVSIERGKTLTYPRNLALTNNVGASRPFYELVEELRDVVRTIALPTPMCYNPIIYGGMVSGKQSETNEWQIDQYILTFSIICQIPRVQYNPPQLSGNGPYVDLNDEQLWQPNTTP